MICDAMKYIERKFMPILPGSLHLTRRLGMHLPVSPTYPLSASPTHLPIPGGVSYPPTHTWRHLQPTYPPYLAAYPTHLPTYASTHHTCRRLLPTYPPYLAAGSHTWRRGPWPGRGRPERWGAMTGDGRPLLPPPPPPATPVSGPRRPAVGGGGGAGRPSWRSWRMDVLRCRERGYLWDTLFGVYGNVDDRVLSTGHVKRSDKILP